MYNNYHCIDGDGGGCLYAFTDTARTGDFLLVPTVDWYRVVRVMNEKPPTPKPTHIIALQKLDLLNEDTSS